MLKKIKIVIIIAIGFILSCNNGEVNIPKPRAYPKVEFPQKKYILFNPEECNFSFEIPEYSEIKKNKYFFKEPAPNDCWYNIVFKNFNGNIFLTYYPISSKSDFDKLINDSFELVSKHDIKASARNEIKIHNKYGTSGILFKLEGEVASHTQFFLTDTSTNFIRGSLYFNNKVNVDSMKIIQDFVDSDVQHLIETFRWK